MKDRFDRRHYPEVANQLLDMKELKGEQVAYIIDLEGKEGLPKMEMCGLEFCGNASRSFALLSAKARGLRGDSKVTVDVSGSDEPLDVEINTDSNYTKIRMPRALRVFDEEIFGVPAQIADYGGINCEDIIGTDPAKRVEYCPQIMAASFEKCMEILEEKGLL